MGRVVWFYPSQNTAEAGFALHPDGGGPYAALIAHVWNDHMVNLSVFDANGAAHPRTSVPMLHGECDVPEHAFCGWMPYQKGQAAKTEAAEKGIVLEQRYREPTQREQLEYALVSGAASALAISPGNARQVVDGIKTVLGTLYPVAATPTSGPDNAHAAAVLYPAIERAMGELSKLHEGFNMEVNRAFNILHDAFWGECPAPASAAPKRRETADAERTLPVIEPGPDALELGIERIHKVNEDALSALAQGSNDVVLLCGRTRFTVPVNPDIQAKADKGPRVTPADIEANIVSEHYFTAADGVIGQQAIKTIEDAWDIEAPAPLHLLTFCVLVLRNGFTVVGHSACASPENFNAEIGRRIARENAEREIWPLLGFRLRDELARPVLTEGDVAADAAGTCRPDNHTSACTACKRA